MPDVMIPGYKCSRCEYEWVGRSTDSGRPAVCANCGSPYWDRERKRKVPKKDQAAKVQPKGTKGK
ncbi:MAG: hypothetical protein ACREB9_07420, partial [Thermoplasmata archaeon]